MNLGSLREALKGLPDGTKLEFQVPSGGDYSGERLEVVDLVIRKVPLTACSGCNQVHYHESIVVLTTR